ncbi:MAG: hypothetical protein Q9178_002005 [Gyalolechia marmorata]
MAQAKLILRLTESMSYLSFTDHMSSPTETWSRLEALPLEIFRLISIHLSFFDKKALCSASRRVYCLMGPIKPPDRFAWRLHLCSSFNRCTDDYFDVTIFKPDDITRELTRITKQIAERPKGGHYALDTTKTRLKDLNCLYFPIGFYVYYGSHKLVCRTLGHFVAIHFRAYVARLLWETKDGEDAASEQRDIDPRFNFTDEHKANLTKEAHQWSLTRDHWMQGFSAPISDYRSGVDNVLPDSAVEATENLVRKMGIQEIYDQNDQECGPTAHQGTQIRGPRRIDLPMFAAEDDSDCDTVLEEDEYSGGEDGALPTMSYGFTEDVSESARLEGL